MLNPGSRSFRFLRLRTNNPAPISSNSDSVTCAATSALRNITEVPPAMDPTWSFNVPANCGRVACSAGTNPKMTPVSMETPNVNNRMRQSGVVEMVSGESPVRQKPDQRLVHPHSQQQSRGAAGNRQREALDQQLRDDASAACAQREAHGDLLLPRGGARDQ